MNAPLCPEGSRSLAFFHSSVRLASQNARIAHLQPNPLVRLKFDSGFRSNQVVPGDVIIGRPGTGKPEKAFEPVVCAIVGVSIPAGIAQKSAQPGLPGPLERVAQFAREGQRLVPFFAVLSELNHGLPIVVPTRFALDAVASEAQAMDGTVDAGPPCRFDPAPGRTVATSPRPTTAANRR